MLSPIEILIIKLKKYKKIYEEISSEEIALSIDQAEQAILNYCNRKVLPQGLYYVCADIAKDLLIYDFSRGKHTESIETAGSKMKVGRVEVSEGESLSITDVKALSNVLEDYQGQLNAFRLLVW